MDSKIAEKLKDRSFVEKLMGFGTPDEVKGFFKKEGIDASDSEVKEMRDSLNNIISNFKEIPDKELDVSGGVGPTDVIGWVGFKIGRDADKENAPDYTTLIENASGEEAEENIDYSFQKGMSGKIGKALFVHRQGATIATGAAAALAVAYAGYKKGWPSLKALGQKKGWWK